MSEAEKVVSSKHGSWTIHGALLSLDNTDHFEETIAAARKARLMAHAPYSKFQVGACALMDGESYAGCNVENASYGATICAERNAIAAGVASGGKKLHLIAITTGADIGVPIGNRSPCGMCRQVISEFATENTLVLLDGGSNDEHEFLGEVIAFDDLLPWQFEFER